MSRLPVCKELRALMCGGESHVVLGRILHAQHESVTGYAITSQVKGNNCMSEIQLPAVTKSTISVLDALTEALGFPRDILASENEIEAAWTNLPRILRR